MKIQVYFLSALAGLILQVVSSMAISAAEDESSETERIVGGRNAVAGQFPWAAVLFSNGNFICTCSIIGPTTVVTAAHCVVSNGGSGPASSYHAIANVRKSSPTVRINFSSVTPHPDYDQSTIANDIAIFKTTEPIPFSDNVQPICIALNDTAPDEYKDVIAMGWGDTNRLRIIPSSPDNLNFVEQAVVSNRNCRIQSFGRQLEDSKICSGENMSRICNGDSGGPLVFMGSSSNPVQVGIASYANAIIGCGFATPSVWTRVSSFNSFIKKQAAPDTVCEA